MINPNSNPEVDWLHSVVCQETSLPVDDVVGTGSRWLEGLLNKLKTGLALATERPEAMLEDGPINVEVPAVMNHVVDDSSSDEELAELVAERDALSREMGLLDEALTKPHTHLDLLSEVSLGERVQDRACVGAFIDGEGEDMNGCHQELISDAVDVHDHTTDVDRFLQVHDVMKRYIAQDAKAARLHSPTKQDTPLQPNEDVDTQEQVKALSKEVKEPVEKIAAVGSIENKKRDLDVTKAAGETTSDGGTKAAGGTSRDGTDVGGIANPVDTGDEGLLSDELKAKEKVNVTPVFCTL